MVVCGKIHTTSVKIAMVDYGYGPNGEYLKIAKHAFSWADVTIEARKSIILNLYVSPIRPIPAIMTILTPVVWILLHIRPCLNPVIRMAWPQMDLGSKFRLL